MKRARINGEGDNNGDEIVKINAGGKLYYTTQKTLTSNFPSSMITRLFTRKEMIPLDDQGNYFIDVDPTLFGALLNAMRRPNLVEIVPAGISEETWWLELDYWGIREYVVMVEEEKGPPALVLKQQLLREKEVAMAKRIKRIDLFVVECIMEWANVDQLLTFVAPNICSGICIKSDTVYIDNDGTISTVDTKSLSCICIATYIWKYKERFMALLKEWTRFDNIYIVMERPSAPYTFNGQRYEATKEELHIRMSHDYHSNT